MMPVSQKPASPQKSSVYTLKAPYRTDPTMKRPRGKTPARLSCRVSKGSRKKTPQGAASPKVKVPLEITKVKCGKISVVENPRLAPSKSNSPEDAKQSSLLWNCSGGGDFANARPSCLGTEQPRSREGTPRACTEPQTSTLQEKG